MKNKSDLEDKLEDLDLPSKWDIKSLRESEIDWWTIILLKIAPLKGIYRLARKKGLALKEHLAPKAHDLFINVERVDIFPYRGGARGFTVVLDNETAIYFNQDGDKFVYDGFENGEYEKGDVTIFDNLKEK